MQDNELLCDIVDLRPLIAEVESKNRAASAALDRLEQLYRERLRQVAFSMLRACAAIDDGDPEAARARLMATAAGLEAITGPLAVIIKH